MLTVHHLGVSQSERVIWLCEELGIPYEIIRYEREPSMAAPAAYKALHPAGTAPTITDGDVTLAETSAVVEYILRRHGGGKLELPPEHKDYANYLFWLHFANGSMIPAVMMEMTAKRYGGEAFSTRTDNAYKMAEQRLGEAPYFAGENFTAADILMTFLFTRMRAFTQHDISGSPNLLAYLQRIGARPAYKAAMEKAEPGNPPKLD
jgi:glutathione S-transferase